MDYLPLPVIALLCYLLWKYVQRERVSRRMNNDLSQLRRPLNIVITGGSRGVGYSLAREFLKRGDFVIICGRSESTVSAAVERLQKDTMCATVAISGTTCDVTRYEDVQRLVGFAVDQLQANDLSGGCIDLWINNAGTTGDVVGKFIDIPTDVIKSVFDTNMLGVAYCSRAAALQMMTQSRGGHIANMDGRGRAGATTCYGVTKRSVVALTNMLSKEFENTRVGFHVTQPGMCLTKLLVRDGQDVRTRRIFNILAEDTDVVANWMVGKLSRIRGTGRSIAYLTPLSVAWRFATFPVRRNRFFDGKTGKYTYRKELLE